MKAKEKEKHGIQIKEFLRTNLKIKKKNLRDQEGNHMQV
jgi:hypothetical protein